jgi:curved DNA-binding protein CbpA
MNATKPYQTQNFYELLELTPGASQDEIRIAYQKSLDLYGQESVAMYALDDGRQVEELRARLDEAWKVLGDESLRGAYDTSLGVAGASRGRKMVTLVPTETSTESTEAPQSQPEPVAASTQPVEVVRFPPVMSLPSPESKFVELEPPGESPPSPVLKEAGETALVKQPEAAAVKREDDKARGKLDIPPEAEFNGELLRRVRESKGKTLQQLADKTRIGKRHLENVEADRYNELPTAVYLRGILMNLARELGLDGLRVSKSYLDLAEKGKK